MLLGLGKAHPGPARGELVLAKGDPGSVGLREVGLLLDGPGEELIPLVGHLTELLFARWNSTRTGEMGFSWAVWKFYMDPADDLRETIVLRVPKQQSPFINLRWKSSFLSPDDPKLESGINQTKVSHYILTLHGSVVRGREDGWRCGETALSSQISTFPTFPNECWLNFPAQS